MTLIMRGRLRFAAVSAAAVAGALASASGAVADPAPPFKDLLTQAQANAPRLAEAATPSRGGPGPPDASAEPPRLAEARALLLAARRVSAAS